MLKKIKISQHEHSGHLKGHEHTSYFPLVILLLLVAFPLITFTASAASPGPEAGSIGLSGQVPSDPPTEAATITLPTNNQRFDSSPVTVSGTCPAGTLVEVFKNDIFAGSTPCTSSGTFSLEIDLLYGENKLFARVYDALNQPGPDSNKVTVFYDLTAAQAGPEASFGFGGEQLLLNTDAVFRGTFPDKPLTIPIDIIGGTPPFAINVHWGDTNNKMVSRNDNNTFRVTHTYAKAGNYQISIQATDFEGRVAFLTVASIVNGQPETVTTSLASSKGVTLGQLMVLWPLYTALLAAVISFWLGERREHKIHSRYSGTTAHA